MDGPSECFQLPFLDSRAEEKVLETSSVPQKKSRTRILQHRASEGASAFPSTASSPHVREDGSECLDSIGSPSKSWLNNLENKADRSRQAPVLASSNSDVASESQSAISPKPGVNKKPINIEEAVSGTSPKTDNRTELWSPAPASSSILTLAGSPEKTRQVHEGGEEEPSFFDYLKSEFNPAPSYPTADAIWGQTERQRVYNAIAYVPYQLERLVWFGVLLCCDSFLAVFTILPVRFVRALHSMASYKQQGKHRKLKLQGQQLTDLLCVAMFGLTYLFLRSLDAGALYFWMKDLTQEFLKLQVIYTAVEMFDKITCSFAVDSLEALSGTCTLFTSSPNKRHHLRHMLSDFSVTLLLVMLHGLILMCQGMAFSVAMNSKRNHALVALIIATNFTEIKGTIFKRFDSSKLFVMTCQDVVERFHLCLSLLFVVAEDMDNSRSAWPNAVLLARCAQIFAAEICIDVIKHAVLGKFNEIRPGVYREFTRDVCDKIKSSHSHNMHKIVCFEPLAPAALFLRIASAILGSKDAKLLSRGLPSLLLQLAFCLLGWGVLCAAKLVLGFWLKGWAGAYLHHFDQRSKKAAPRPPHAPRNLSSRSLAPPNKVVKKE